MTRPTSEDDNVCVRRENFIKGFMTVGGLTRELHSSDVNTVNMCILVCQCVICMLALDTEEQRS